MDASVVKRRLKVMNVVRGQMQHVPSSVLSSVQSACYTCPNECVVQSISDQIQSSPVKSVTLSGVVMNAFAIVR